MFIVAALFVAANVFLAIIPIFIGKLVGALATTPPQTSNAIIYVWALIVCSSGHDILWRSAEIAYMKLLNPLLYSYENILFSEVISKPYPYFVDKFTGKLASYVSTISQEMRGLAETFFYNYISQAVNLLAIIFILSSINWQTSIIFISGIILMAIAGKFTIGNSIKYERIAADVVSTKNGKIIDIIGNFISVKAFHKEFQELQSIRLEQTKTIKAANQSFAWSIFFWGSMSFFVRHLIWPITIAFNVHMFLNGQISIGQLTTLLATILLFSSTIWDIIWQFSQLNLKLARVEEAHTYLFGAVKLKHSSEVARRVAGPIIEQSLTLNNLSFNYPDKADTTVLKDISIVIQKGEKIGVVGKSGSGKSTLAKLLLGYYPVANGSIELDGQTIDTQSLSQLVSYVPQDTSLFHRSVSENIAYATSRDVEHSDIVHAATQANADEFIVNIADGYDALVGERGVKLSAGQRQRISIARAFLDDKPILILDEATSALDSESEVLVQEALELLWEDKTVIAIAHRLSTLRHMDRIIVIDNGHISEQGSHNELLKNKGLYAKLWLHQSGGFIEE
ncbi:MAG: ABC transporter ATP-binding protein [Candidatus Saccharimonadales bacterium]